MGSIRVISGSIVRTLLPMVDAIAVNREGVKHCICRIAVGLHVEITITTTTTITLVL